MVVSTDIKVIKIKLPNDLIASEVEYICDLHKENWEEAHDSPPPKMFADVNRREGYLYLPMIKRVLEDMVLRLDDFIDIADDNLRFQKSGFSINKKGLAKQNESIKHYSDIKKGLQVVKRAVIAASKRR